ncbi:MAG: hypothetical protein ACI8XO_004478, partial [Verrucomicrobiales bacterium]
QFVSDRESTDMPNSSTDWIHQKDPSRSSHPCRNEILTGKGAKPPRFIAYRQMNKSALPALRRAKWEVLYPKYFYWLTRIGIRT